HLFSNYNRLNTYTCNKQIEKENFAMTVMNWIATVVKRFDNYCLNIIMTEKKEKRWNPHVRKEKHNTTNTDDVFGSSESMRLPNTPVVGVAVIYGDHKH
ncbi:hypothetical protein VIGAN_08352500, partial [Vigna angularis var. angularis]